MTGIVNHPVKPALIYPHLEPERLNDLLLNGVEAVVLPQLQSAYRLIESHAEGIHRLTPAGAVGPWRASFLLHSAVLLPITEATHRLTPLLLRVARPGVPALPIERTHASGSITGDVIH